MTKVRAKITVTETATIELEAGETVEDFKDRFADIYLHGAGAKGHIEKQDLGGNTEIEVLEVIEETENA